MLRNQAQSTVEYIILVTAVIAVSVVFLLSPTSNFQKKYTNTLDIVTTQMENMATRITQATSP
jgi:hypothetical protein